MRARNVLCTLGIGALAISVSAYAAPREAQTGKSPRPGSNRLIAGQGGELRAGIEGGTVATGQGAHMSFVPVRSTPAGNASGNNISLAGGPATVVVDAFYGGWAGTGQNLKTFQIGFGAAASFGTGSGGALDRAQVLCASDGDCATAFGVGAFTNPDLKCNDFNPGHCNHMWESTNRPDYIAGFNIPACSQGGDTCGDTTLGAGTADGGSDRYGMSFALNVPANAAGTYTLHFDEPTFTNSFLQVADGSVITGDVIKLTFGTITIPTGRCCFGLGTVAEGCIDSSGSPITAADCAGRPQPSIFQANTLCPANGGPECAACTQPGSTSDPACNDNDACTVDTCRADQTACDHVETPAIGADECCNPANNARTNKNDGDPCTDDICSAGGNRGTASNPASPDGASCDDDNPCSGFDQCTDGLCAGTNVNGVVCLTDADCQAGGTPGAVCDGGACLCRLNPNVSIVLSHDAPDEDKDAACYADGEKVTATVHVGPAANTLVGVQFAITYDESCLDYVSISPAGPWTQVLMVRTGGQCAGGVRDGQACGAQGCAQGGGTCVPAGTIFYAAGIPLGGAGVQGNSDAAVLSFTKNAGCVSCDICFSDNNPLHTRFSDDTGQAVGADTKCSDTIRTKSGIDLDTPETTKVNKGCNSNVATVTWPAITAGFGCNEGELVCNGIHLESGQVWDQAHVQGGGVFPGGNSNFCCTATNDCGNAVENCWTVTVNDETSLEVEVQLSPTMATKAGGGITRCIKFEVFNNCVQAPICFSTDLEFGGLLQLVGHFNGHVKIPAAVQPACITARDQRHTLRSCYTFGEGDCDANGSLHATFKQDPFFGGNWLIGGNLDGWKKSNPNASHDIIDILDFGSLVAEWLKSYDSDGDGNADGNTPCNSGECDEANANHADINGDGVVDLLDFSYISMNFLDNSKDCCCPGSASLGNTVGRTEISTRELREQGMSDLSVADLNADGKVDMTDMAALMNGVRPNLKSNTDGKDGSRSNNRK